MIKAAIDDAASQVSGCPNAFLKGSRSSLAHCCSACDTGAMARRSQFLCQHCGRRVFAEGGPLTELRLCRSCFEKARQVQRQELKAKAKPD
jgi:hypothetical protein